MRRTSPPPLALALLLAACDGQAPPAPDAAAGTPVDAPVEEDAPLADEADAPAPAGDDAPAGVAADAGAGNGCVGPVPGCRSRIDDTCDPVCQVGCGCNLQCVTQGLTFTCRPPPERPLEVGAACGATPEQCPPGSTCLNYRAGCGSWCYRFCRGDEDCGKGRCALGGGVPGYTSFYSVCTSPVEDCDPTGNALCAAADRPGPTFGCFLVSPEHGDLATCECAGRGRAGESCRHPYDCSPGHTCVGSPLGRHCRAVCKLGDPNACSGGGCTRLPAPSRATVYGHCR